MGRHPKFQGAELRRLIETARRDGASSAARAFGLSRAAVRRYVAKADAEGLPPVEDNSKTTRRQLDSQGTARPPLKSTTAGGDPYPFLDGADDRERAEAADAAHRGANGASSPPAGEAEPIQTGATPEPDHVPLTGEALVDLSEMAIAMAGHVAVVQSGLELDAETSKLLDFTERERAKLLVTAPYAARYLDQFISNAPLVAAITYGVSLAIVGAGKIMAVRAAAKAKAPKADRKPPRFTTDPLTAEIFDKPAQ